MIIPIRAIPKFKNKETTHSDMADNRDIRNAIFGAVPEANKQVKEFAKYFGRNNQRESCKAIFDFLKHKINYVADADLQLIKLPYALLHTKVGDCKSYSLLTSAILTNLGIPHHFVLVSYNNDPTPSHIYVETDDGCIIDAVWGIFDSEKKPTYKYKVKPNGKMKVASITGTGKQSTLIGASCGCGCPSCRMNASEPRNGLFDKAGDKLRQGTNWAKQQADKAAKEAREKAEKAAKAAKEAAEKAAQKAKELAQKGFQGYKGVALAPGRNLLLIILKANLDGIASKMQKMNFAEISKYWKKAGGDPKKLQSALSKGASKKPKKLGLLGMIKKIAGKKVNGIGQINENAIKVAIPTATTAAGAAIEPVSGSAAGVSLGAVLTTMLPIVIQLLQSMGKNDEADALMNVSNSLTGDEAATEDTDSGSGSSSGDGAGAGGDKTEISGTTIALIGAAALAAIYFGTQKKG